MLITTQLFLILAARNHYTVDLVAAGVIVLLTSYCDVKFFPNEVGDNNNNQTSSYCYAEDSDDQTHFAMDKKETLRRSTVIV
jgi:hypothetical protein